ncbi:hypothetical protein DYB35_007323 [Aphanomyces astaci]|uniref:Chromatin modification-related protein EAF6 n=1 Tax=Aphanomyces astaci TaxID=112090 RepID=A0A3R7A9B5_APHAT|nr:hypothetical protein DYB35_007323 [Aphanomyces astaci]
MRAGEWHSRWPRRYRATLTSKSTFKKKMNLLLQMRRSAKARKSSSSSLLPRGQTKALTWHVLAIRPSRFDFALDDAWRVVVAMDFPYCVTNGAYNTYPAGLRLRDIAFSSLRAPPILSKSTQKSMVQYGADKDTTPLPRHAVLSHQAFVVFEMEDAETGHWKPLGHEHGITCICSCTCGGNTASPTSAAKRKVVESPAKLPPPSKKSKVAKSTTPRRPSRHGKPVEIDTHESTNETQADVVRRRRSPRGVSVPKSNEDADHNPPAAATDSIPPPHAHDDEITSTTAAAALKMDEETRKMDEELKAWMGKRSDEQEELTQLERQIYELEGAYLRRSQHAGNIVKGYADANVFVAEMAKDELQDPPPNEVVDAQRVFSHSSTTSPAEPPLHVATAAATETAAVAAPPVDVPNHSVVDTHATADRARTLSQELAEADEV